MYQSTGIAVKRAATRDAARRAASERRRRAATARFWSLDVDVFIEPARENAQHTLEALRAFGYDVSDLSVRL
jgi:hypothetical protein